MPDQQTIQEHEEQEVLHRASPGGRIVYESVMHEANEELARPTSALFWSGLAAGLSMGFSFIGEGLLKHYVPHRPWAPLISKLGYSIGFIIVILGRQQLFTENTLTPMLPLMRKKDAATFANVMRLWGVVLVANLIGALLIAVVCARTNAFDAGIRATFIELGHRAMEHGFGTVLLRGIFAGWLIALIVWMLPYSESSHLFVILIITYIVGLGNFAHVVAGAVEVFALAWTGEKPWGTVIGSYIIPALIGNIFGGVTLVAALNHAQVTSGEE